MLHICEIVISILAVYGGYTLLHELANLLYSIAERIRGKKNTGKRKREDARGRTHK